MLLAFYKENELDSFKSYRDFLLDLLECYERKKWVRDALLNPQWYDVQTLCNTNGASLQC